MGLGAGRVGEDLAETEADSRDGQGPSASDEEVEWMCEREELEENDFTSCGK
jgi:hypothetical protein